MRLENGMDDIGSLSKVKVGDFKLPYLMDGPLPFKVEYPYGLPGDDFRTHARDYNATCVAYHRGVDPALLAAVSEPGNLYRYEPGDERYDVLKESMIEKGFVGGSGQRLIIHVDDKGPKIAEGNHRLRVAVEIGIKEVEVEVRYLKNADERMLLIPFDFETGQFPVIHE